MSREQWGHGYWKGVEDAQNGEVKTLSPGEALFWILNMCLSNLEKSYSKSLFPVKEFIPYVAFCGYSVSYAKKVYSYILRHNGFRVGCHFINCYITGPQKQYWQEDSFVLPVGYSENELLTMREAVIKSLEEQND